MELVKSALFATFIGYLIGFSSMVLLFSGYYITFINP